MPEPVQTTRYDRVQEILDLAAAESTADYGGRGRFWRLSHSEFLNVDVYGVRMIAPAEPVKHSCCGGHECAEASVSRGAASGLVRGLRGEPPFDGSQFPPLPWGGRRVAEEDIAFISDWIDDGCPVDDREAATFEVQGTTEALPREFEVYDGSPNEYRTQYGELKQRVNLDCLLPSEVAKLRWAFRELYRLNKWPEDRRSYNNVALIHQNHCQHGWERFLPWHRIYLYEFEQVLQDVCPGVTLPYWDWTMRRYKPEKPEDGDIIPTWFQCFITRESLDYLRSATPDITADEAAALEPMVGKLFTSPTKFFAKVVELTNNAELAQGHHRNRFIDALLATNSLWYPLRYPAEYGKNPKTTINQAVHYHYPTADDMRQILSLRTFRDFGGGNFYNDSFGFLDQNPHNTMHLWTGGINPDPVQSGPDLAQDLGGNRNRGVQIAGRRFHTSEDLYTRPKYGDMFSNLTASYDPIFWPIHVNVDRTWAEWQELNPHSLPIDLGAVLTPWSYTIADTLDHRRFGYEYVRCGYLVPVGLGEPIGRFVSKPMDVPENARAFSKAEVRLHRVPQLERSCFIRVFLNNPDANAATPLDDPSYAGYLAIFGHGPCYGGPGHCDLPPSRTRPYDLRPRSHNTPRNHRVDVTKTARALLDEQGASSLQITLVVIGADYEEDSGLLRLESVSLEFLD